jgi:hypothetical protein
MMRRSLLFLIFLIPLSNAFAQKVFNARVFENKTRIPLQGIMATNQNNNQVAVTDDSGDLHIIAKKGDVLILKGFAYQPDTVLLTSLRDQEIFLVPRQNQLKQVNVTTTVMPNENTSQFKDPEFHGQSMIFHRDTKGNYDGGVVFRVWYWKKQDKKIKKEADRRKEEQLREEIIKVFSPANLGKYLPLKDQEMDAFIIRYVPDVAIYSSPAFNLLVYLNSSYKEFNSLPPDERKPQKLE